MRITLQSLDSEFPGIKVCTDEKQFFNLIPQKESLVILLNLDLNPRDAITLLGELQGMPNRTHSCVIIYSDKQEDFLLELAYDSGADSFITFHLKPAILKPFLRNLIRRLMRPLISTKALYVDQEKFQVYHNNRTILMPRKEFQLFSLFYYNRGRFFSKTEIARLIWNNETVAQKRTIDVHIYKIRQFFNKNIILSKKGAGYKLNEKAV